VNRKLVLVSNDEEPLIEIGIWCVVCGGVVGLKEEGCLLEGILLLRRGRNLGRRDHVGLRAGAYHGQLRETGRIPRK